MANSGFARLAIEFGDLVQLLVEVGLNEFELSFIAGEELRAGISIERVCHDVFVVILGVGVCRMDKSVDDAVASKDS